MRITCNTTQKVLQAIQQFLKKITNPRNRKKVIVSVIFSVIVPVLSVIIPMYNQYGIDVTQNEEIIDLKYRLSNVEKFLSKNEEDLFNRGWDALKNKEYLKASELFQQVFDINPKNINSINNKGVALVALGHLDQAIPLFEQFLDKAPEDPIGLANLAMALSDNNNFEDAIPYYERAFKDPAIKNNDDYWVNYGVALRNVGRSAEAVNAYFQALKINENNTNALNNFGNILGTSGFHLDAVRYYDKIIELVPNPISAHNNKGWNLERLGFFQNAIDEYDKALELDNNYSEAQYNKAQALEKIINFGKYEQQQRYFITEVLYLESMQEFEGLMTCNSSDLSTAMKIEVASDKLAVSHNRENDFEWKVSLNNTDDEEHSATIKIECIKKLQ